MIKSSWWKRSLVSVQLVAQMATAILPFYPNIVHAQSAAVGSEQAQPEAAQPVRTQNATAESEQTQREMAQRLSAFGTSATSGNATSALGQQAGGMATKATQDWLKQYGTARVELNISDKFKGSTGAIDFLFPLMDSESRLLFTQMGIRRKDSQITGNVGIGQRHFVPDWMLGYNAFFDQNLSRGYQRLGVGAEAWRDYLKLSGNGYLRISNWKDTSDLLDYQARPANGFDLRAEGYLPSHPSLGAKLMYEQYFGNEVALGGINDRRSNPGAVTVGLSYTPISLLTLSADRRRGGGTNDTRFGVQINYAIGQSWESQTDASKVTTRRSLASSRYDLVERNNDIVLEYRKKEVLKLFLTPLEGPSGSSVQVNYTYQSKYPLNKFSCTAPEFVAAGGVINDLGGRHIQLDLPQYIPGGKNVYEMVCTLTDDHGNTATEKTPIKVDPPAASSSKTKVSARPTIILANGSSLSIVSIDLRDDSNLPMTGQAQNLAATMSEALNIVQPAVGFPPQAATLGAIREVSSGHYEALVTAGTRAGTIKVSPTFNGKPLTPVSIIETNDPTTAHIAAGELQVMVNASLANGVAQNQVRATVRDASGNILPGMRVTFSLSGAAQVASGSSLVATTDAQGQVTLNFTDTVVEMVAVGAILDNGNDARVGTEFVGFAIIGPGGSSGLTVDKTDIIANGVDTATYTATVMDRNGNPAPSVTVHWVTNLGNLSGATSTTDANGKAIIKLTGRIAGRAQVTADIGDANAVAAPIVTLHADRSTATLRAVDVTVDKTTVAANGIDVATFSAIVKDINGNPVPNFPVNWGTNFGTLGASTTNTGSNGEAATVTLSSTAGGTAQVTAALNGQAPVNAPLVNFTGDPATADIVVTVSPTQITAGGTATFTATVTDARGFVVPNLPVTWSVTSGSGTLTPTSTTTDTSGVTTTSFTGTVAGNVQVTATIPNGRSGNATVQVIADASRIGSVSISGNPSGQFNICNRVPNPFLGVIRFDPVADLIATVTDIYGNQISNPSVSWSVSGNPGSFSPNPGAATQFVGNGTKPIFSSAQVVWNVVGTYGNAQGGITISCS